MPTSALLRRRPPLVQTDVVPGVHRITHAFTNCYLITDADGITLVDAGFPSTWASVRRCLAELGRTTSEIRCLILTHGHFDHVGFARPLAAMTDVPVLVHPDDRRLAAHPFGYRPERNRLGFSLTRPRAWPVLASMVAAGALRSRGVDTVSELTDDAPLDVPGRPRVVHTPGHTAGECVLHLADRSVVISGDALVTLDPYTGLTGPRLVAPAATADVEQARRSLQASVGLDADLVLPGHGEPWTAGWNAAVDRALDADPYGR